MLTSPPYRRREQWHQVCRRSSARASWATCLDRARERIRQRRAAATRRRFQAIDDPESFLSIHFSHFCASDVRQSWGRGVMKCTTAVLFLLRTELTSNLIEGAREIFPHGSLRDVTLFSSARISAVLLSKGGDLHSWTLDPSCNPSSAGRQRRSRLGIFKYGNPPRLGLKRKVPRLSRFATRYITVLSLYRISRRLAARWPQTANVSQSE